MRLIDADALESVMDDKYTLGDCGRRERDDVVDALRYNAPTVDAVPVCRCENCVYWDAGTRRHNSNDVAEWDEAICDNFHEIGINQDVFMATDDFCSYGERKGVDE